MQKKSTKKLMLHKETLRNLDEKTLEKIVAGAELCPTLHCTDPAYTCTHTE
jgi:hypothetical protein